ncbi:MAG: acyltransferase [Proteobacteria bacterium]|nr:acyltransferase [Pseudomonadota bacterium]
MQNFLINYETVKLNIVSPNLTNLWILLAFFLLVLLATRKTHSGPDGLLSIPHTDQLKGLAIFFVVLGHLWLHVSKVNATHLFSGDGVSMFFLLSGFGLALSNKKRKLRFGEFCSRRIRRVMIPYWIATILILLLDFFILKRTYPAEWLALTFCGINVRIELMHLDYTRWFVTFLLVWYGVFFLAFSQWKAEKAALITAVAAVVLLWVNFRYLHFGWYQFLPFSAGCLLGTHYEKLAAAYRHKSANFMAMGIALALYLLIYRYSTSFWPVYRAVIQTVPPLSMAYLSDANSLIFCLALILLSGKLVERGYQSRVLLFLGKYSYEIFLLHGPFLIKYNPVIRDNGSVVVTFQFMVFLGLIAVFSSLMYRVNSPFYAKKPAK